MAMDDNLKYALETVERIASKNTESRIAKNLDFLFGENYSKYGAFRRAVNDLFTKIIPSSDGKETLKVPHRERMDIINEKLNAFDISNSKEAYEAYDNMMGYVKTGIYRTSPFSLRENSIFDEVVNRAKEQGLLDKDIRALFETTIENAKHYGVYNSDWEISDDIYNSYFPDSAPKEVKRTKRRKDREYRINDDIVNDYRKELAKIQAEQRSLNLEMEYEGKTPERLARSEELQTRAHTLIETIDHRTGNFTLEELRAADGDINKLNQLQLNPPREGAPMFEGLAVPSEFVDENGNVIHDKYRRQVKKNKLYDKEAREANKEINKFQRGNVIVDKNGNRFVIEGFHEADKSLGNYTDYYGAYDKNGRAVNLIPDRIADYTVLDDVVNVDALEKLYQARTDIDQLMNQVDKVIHSKNNSPSEKYFEQYSELKKKLEDAEKNLEGKYDLENDSDYSYMREKMERFEKMNSSHFKSASNNTQQSDIPPDIDLDELNKQWMDQKQAEFANREQEIKDEFSDLDQYDPDVIADPNYEPPIINDMNVDKTVENTIEETLEDTAEQVIKNTAENVVEETAEQVIKKTTGLNVELDDVNGSSKKKKHKRKTKKQRKTEKKQKRKKYEDRNSNSKPEFKKTGNDTSYLNNPNYKKQQTQEEFFEEFYQEEGKKSVFDTIHEQNQKELEETFDAIEENKTRVDLFDNPESKEQLKRKKFKKFSDMSKLELGFTALNLVGAIGDYKDARREGKSVVGSVAHAGVRLAMDEMLGISGSIAVGIASAAPKLVIQGTQMLYRENRKMNSAANNQVFGDAVFQDTQQLATMRQSGMEMAKMAQYNLQQTLMGNEATYFHR